MEMRRLKALYKLAKDILNDAAEIRFNEELFTDEDTDKISLTLKNYERPQGVAT